MAAGRIRVDGVFSETFPTHAEALAAAEAAAEEQEVPGHTFHGGSGGRSFFALQENLKQRRPGTLICIKDGSSDAP
jgi:hypothetical protein